MPARPIRLAVLAPMLAMEAKRMKVLGTVPQPLEDGEGDDDERDADERERRARPLDGRDDPRLFGQEMHFADASSSMVKRARQPRREGRWRRRGGGSQDMSEDGGGTGGAAWIGRVVWMDGREGEREGGWAGGDAMDWGCQ